MNLDALKSWLDGYGRAWENKDPDAAGALFAENASYHETPYDEPMQGRSAVVEYWSHVPRTQENIHFSYEVLGLQGDKAFVHWASSFTRIPSNSKVKLDGIFALRFDERNLCTSLREWWMRQES